MASTPKEIASQPVRMLATRRLRPRERATLAREIVVAYVHARRSLRSPILEAVERLRAQPDGEPSGVASGGGNEEARRLGRAVMMTLRFLPGDTRCLVRSLVLTRLLARRGIAAKLVIGARAEPDFLAHAWVEHNGCPVLPRGQDSFLRLVEL